MSLDSRHTTAATVCFLNGLHDALTCRQPIGVRDRVNRMFEASDLPKSLWGFAVTLYQATTPRLVVVRAAQLAAFENILAATNQLMKHDRFDEFAVHDRNRCRMQVDFIVDEPQPVALAELSDAVLPEHGFAAGNSGESDVTASQPFAENAHHGELSGDFAPWQMQVENWTMPMKQTRFELGIDGLRIVKEGKRRYFLPGDAFVHSILGMSQLRRHIQRLFPGDDIEKLTYYRFRSISFVSGVKGMKEGEIARQGDGQSGKGEAEGYGWVPLYRGLPPVPVVNDASLMRAARAGTKWIADNVQSDGRFTYYYDAATDTRRDHEHPTRDPETDPYYNLLRHAGGVITLLLDEALGKKRSGVSGQRSAGSVGTTSSFNGKPQATGNHIAVVACGLPLNDSLVARRSIIERTVDFLIDQLVTYETSDGREAAYALYNRKAKLGGSGIGLVRSGDVPATTWRRSSCQGRAATGDASGERDQWTGRIPLLSHLLGQTGRLGR